MSVLRSINKFLRGCSIKKIVTVAVLMVFLSVAFAYTENGHKEGDYWRYAYRREGSYRSSDFPPQFTIVFKSGKLVLEDDEETRIGAGVPTVLGVETNIPWFNFPLEVGKEWPYFSSRMDASFAVEKREQITVKAGAFEAYKITRFRFGRGSSVLSYWYAPETKSVVKGHLEGTGGTTIEYELLEYGNKKGK